jgi:hypothetical protein
MNLQELRNSPKVSDCAAVVSLHACGTASDLAIVGAVKHNLPFAVSPCCIGKVKTAWQPGTMPVIENVGDHVEVVHPRSCWLREIVSASEYALLAKAADYGVVYKESDCPKEKSRRIQCRLAKRIMEADRLQWAKENGYIVKMVELPRIGCFIRNENFF